MVFNCTNAKQPHRRKVKLQAAINPSLVLFGYLLTSIGFERKREKKKEEQASRQS